MLMFKIPFLKPNVVPQEFYQHYLQEIDRTNIYSNYGPINGEFERRLKEDWFHNEGALTTVSNATLGLMLAISQTKRANAKYAIMPSFTFSATPLAAQWCGLIPYFVDINEDDWFMNETKLKEALSHLGEDAAVVVPYATFGNNLDVDFYCELIDQGIPVVIDAAPCFGATKEGRHFGQGFEGAVVFSFHATKTFGIGEGGVVYSNNDGLIRNIRTASNFGYYGARESTTLGLNAKLPEILASVGLASLGGYGGILETKQRLYNIYLEELQSCGLVSKGWSAQRLSGEVPHQFFSLLCPTGMENKRVIDHLGANGIQAVTYFSPACHQQAQFLQCPRGDLNNTEKVAKRILSLPLWSQLEKSQIVEIVNTLAI